MDDGWTFFYIDLSAIFYIYYYYMVKSLILNVRIK